MGGGSLKLSGIIVLVLLLNIRPVVNEMKMAQAAEERSYGNRKVKELGPGCEDNECRVECENDGYGKGRCFSDSCLCFEPKKGGGAEEAEKRQLEKYDRPSCTSDPPCITACKKDGFCSGQCLEYICYCLPNCTAHHNHYPPQLT